MNTFLPLFQLDPANGSNQPLRLSDRAKAFKSDAEVWDALFQNPRYVLSDFGNAGDTMTLTTLTGKLKLKVIGVQQGGILDGIAASPQTLARFQGLPRGSTVMVDVKEGVDATVLARPIEARLFSKGVDAQTTKKLLDDSYRASKTFFSVIDILMRMGLVVGILSLGILGLRAVVERRHVIGVLRAIGYRKRGVLAGLMAEAGVTATLGVGVGVVTGLTMGWLFVRQQASSSFGIDGASLGGVIALVYLAVVAVTFGPAWRASRLPPAEAVRYTE